MFCSTSTIATPLLRISASFANTISTNFGDSPADGSSSISAFGLGQQRARDGEHLPLPAGEPSGQQAALPREVGKGVVHRGDPLGAPGGRQTSRGELQIVVDAHPGEHILGLRREGQPARIRDGPACASDRCRRSVTLPRSISGARPAIALISVDLPAPFGPSTATISPRAA